LDVLLQLLSLFVALPDPPVDEPHAASAVPPPQLLSWALPPPEFDVLQFASEAPNHPQGHQWAEACWGEMASITTTANTSAPAFLINRRRDVVFSLLIVAFSLFETSLFVSDIFNAPFQARLRHKANMGTRFYPFTSGYGPIGVCPT
jgi:hypothetical protein